MGPTARKRRPPPPKRDPSSAASATKEAPPVGPVMEFRQPKDDAWYSVNLVLMGETLVVKYREFPADVEFDAGKLVTPGEIIDFRRRFRPLNKQLEASDCGAVKEGMSVCVLREFASDDRRYYDAVVELVKRRNHNIEDGIEKCSCSFVVSWLHGPEFGTLASARIEDLCPIQSSRGIDPRLSCFLQIAKWKHGIESPCLGLFSEEDMFTKVSAVSSSNLKPPCVVQKSRSAMQTEGALLYDKGMSVCESDEDVDMGGGGHACTDVRRMGDHYSHSVKKLENTSAAEKKASVQENRQNGHPSDLKERLEEDVVFVNLKEKDNEKSDFSKKNRHYFILVDNLEKNISSSTVVDFIREVTSLEIEAYVFSSLPSEPFTRGALVVDSVEKLEKLCNFLSETDHIITSSRGRPWVVSDDSGPEEVTTSFCSLESDLKTVQHADGDELKVVQLGTEEYRKAKQLYRLYLDFVKDQAQLFESLAEAEEEIFGLITNR